MGCARTDWSTAAVGSEDTVRIEYDYARFVTGEEHQFDLDLHEEQLSSPIDGDQVVPDPLQEESMVPTSDEVHIHRCFQLCRLL